jgi:hypothetical protein
VRMTGNHDPWLPSSAVRRIRLFGWPAAIISPATGPLT